MANKYFTNKNNMYSIPIKSWKYYYTFSTLSRSILIILYNKGLMYGNSESIESVICIRGKTLLNYRTTMPFKSRCPFLTIS